MFIYVYVFPLSSIRVSLAFDVETWVLPATRSLYVLNSSKKLF